MKQNRIVAAISTLTLITALTLFANPTPASATTFPPYPGGPYTGGFFVGGDGGNNFIVCGGTDGRLVRTFGVWKGNDTNGPLRGIRIIFNDGAEQMVGDRAGEYAEITLAPTEKVTALTLWGDGRGRRTGRVKFQTSAGQTFDWGKNTSGQTAYPAPVGSGLLAGIAGRAGSDIDMLSLVFLTGVHSVTMDGVRYTTVPDGGVPTGGIAPVLVGMKTFENRESSPVVWSFPGSVKRTTSQEWGNSTSTQYGVSVTVNASAFGIVTAGAGFNWQYTETQSYTRSVSEEITIGWDLQGTLQPGQSTLATATAQMGVLDLPYKATVRVRMVDENQSFSYETHGTFTNVVYTAATVTNSPVSSTNHR